MVDTATCTLGSGTGRPGESSSGSLECLSQHEAAHSVACWLLLSPLCSHPHPGPSCAWPADAGHAMLITRHTPRAWAVSRGLWSHPFPQSRSGVHWLQEPKAQA